MRYRELGGTGLTVSEIGYGAWGLGQGAWVGADDDSGVRALHRALDLGVNFVDTARAYDRSECVVGRALRELPGGGDGVHVATKVGPKVPVSLEPSGLDPMQAFPGSHLRESLETSLRELGRDHVDLLQLHTCTEDDLRRGEVIEVLERARARGQTRFVGYSGDGATARYAVECGSFDTLQTSINVADQEAIELTVPAARARGVGVIAKRPIANAAWRTGRRPDNDYHHTYWERLQRLDYDFLRRPPAESIGVALRFTAAIVGVQTLIVGTTRPGRWRENAAWLDDGVLPAREFEGLRDRWRAVADASWVGQR
jgi:aryl-alcohol dehydrogenase-like predicted oxidoreductase